MEPMFGPGGIACFRKTHESGAEAVIAQHGGHLVSWKTADGKERLYLSETAEFQREKAIRGGVPVIFPQFSDRGPYGRHGFARKMAWEPPSDFTNLRLTLSSSEATLAEWPHDFKIQVSVELVSDKALELSLSIHNSGSEAFAFQAALHSYFRVDDLSRATVRGLEGLPFENEVTKQTEIAEESEGIGFGGEIDRAYLGTGSRSVKLDTGSDVLQIESDKFADVVVWNPGPDHGIGDLPEDGWRQFVCVEAAQVQPNQLSLSPKAIWTGTQRITVLEQ